VAQICPAADQPEKINGIAPKRKSPRSGTSHHFFFSHSLMPALIIFVGHNLAYIHTRVKYRGTSSRAWVLPGFLVHFQKGVIEPNNLEGAPADYVQCDEGAFPEPSQL
jgi:hypothetical protein